LVAIDLGLTCNSNVCLNGGTCNRNDTNIGCACPVNFAGPRCEWSMRILFDVMVELERII
jgi:hypothetical protein